MERRDFLQKVTAGFLLTAIHPLHAIEKQKQIFLTTDLKKSLLKRKSYGAYQTATFQGNKILTKIEGEIPSFVDGKIIKIGPGTKEFNTLSFNHFFDGDAYLSEFDIKDRQVFMRSTFLPTPHRLHEQANKKMLYHEFGTQSPERKNLGRKNQPNINFFFWNQSLLTLSEGAHPIAFRTKDLTSLGTFDFEGALPKNVSFAAHPKFDPVTKDGFCFGIVQGLSKALVVFKLDRKKQSLIELYRLNQKHVFMIHDMLMTENYLIFIIPPAMFKITDIILGKKPMAETLEFDPSMKTRVIVLPKNSQKENTKKEHEEMFECELPSSLVFHHGNAYEENGVIKLQTFLASDASLLDLIGDWTSLSLPKVTLPSLYECEIDLKTKKVIKHKEILKAHDFPVFNNDFSMRKNNFIYASSMENPEDPMAFHSITKLDLETYSRLTFPMAVDEMCSEIQFIPNRDSNSSEDDGAIAYMGYNKTKNETYLEFLDAKTLTKLSRVWTGEHLPLGFHGHFISREEFNE